MEIESAQHALTATRFLIWTLLLIASWFATAQLWKLCHGRFWSGNQFNRFMFGLSFFFFWLAMHQAFWWANEHFRTVGHCTDIDPAIYNADICAYLPWFISASAYVTPVFYAGMLIGVIAFLPPMIVEVAGVRMIQARIAVKIAAAVLWVGGWLLASP